MADKKHSVKAKKNHASPANFLILAIVFGLLAWGIDAILDYFIFYRGEGSFTELLITDIPAHELYIRSAIFSFFLIFGAIIYIHEGRRKSAERKLKVNEENLRITLHSIGDAVIATDELGRVVRMNPLAEELTGWEYHEAQNRPLQEIFHIINSKTRKPVVDPVEKVIKNGITVGLANHTMLISKQGREYQIADSAAPIMDESRVFRGVVMVFRDVTTEYRLRQAIIDNEENLRNLYRSMNEGLCQHEIVYDEKGNAIDYRILDANPKYEDLLGLKLNQVMGRLSTEAYKTSSPPYFDIYLKVAETGNPGQFTTFFEPMDKYFSISVFSPGKGKFVTVFEDITERKVTEKELKKKNVEYQAMNAELVESLERIKTLNLKYTRAREKAEESDRLKTAFLANLSHEIRTPMNGILGFAGLLKEENLSKARQMDYLETIERSGQRMLNLINDLIDISRIESGQIEIQADRFNLNNLLNDILHFFIPDAKQKGVKLEYSADLKDEESYIIADNAKLEQILLNLLKNALKFIRQGKIDFGYKLKAGSLEFFVRDTGPGINKEDLEIIFDRFRQSEGNHLVQEEGIGLGLSISRSFVEAMGGKIWVESMPGDGSVFYFSIPYKQGSKSAEKDFKEIKTETQFDGKPLILIAEDDEYSYLYLKELLSNMGLKTLHAPDGRKAVELIKTSDKINMVFLDIRMPVLNGWEVMEKIKKHNSNIPVIIQTAYASKEDEKRAYETGCSGYISKPVDKLQLQKIIGEYIQL